MKIEISIDGQILSFVSFKSHPPDLRAAEDRLERESRRRKLSFSERFSILHPPTRLILYTASEATELEISGWSPEYGLPFEIKGRAQTTYPRNLDAYFRKDRPLCASCRMSAPRPLTLEETQMLSAASEHHEVLCKIAERMPPILERANKVGEEIREEALLIVKAIRNTDPVAAAVLAEYMDGGNMRRAAKAGKVSIGKASKILNAIESQHGLRLIRHRKGTHTDQYLADTYQHNRQIRSNRDRHA